MTRILFIFVCGIILSSIYLYAQESRLDKIEKNNEIKVCIWPQYYGISYIDSRTQKLAGIDSDLAKELAKDLGVKLKLVKSSFPTLINDITTDKCDIAMFAIGDTKKRREKMRFTTPHLKSDIYAITTKTNRKIKSWDDIDKKGVIVAVAKGTYHEPVMKKRLKNAQLLVVKGFKQREEEVQSGRADVFMTDYPYGKKMLAKTNWAKLIVPKKIYQLTYYAWTMAYGDEKFYNRVEKFVKDIKSDGRLLNIAKNNDLEAIVNID
ncbi:MAG: ABC transporter substrate-binding protein [Halarcobacter sp.]